MADRLDPVLLLAFSIQSQPGIYALLLGSGVSRSAGIMTGWEITRDLVSKLRRAVEEEPPADASEDDLDEWYRTRFGKALDYSELLDDLSKTPSERNLLLRGYFEPTPDEREAGLKQPVACHRAIAELVASGYIRVIVTTNFDRLLELALQNAGVRPTVVSTPDAMEGLLPLQHIPCLVVKVHGDYLDTRIKNTAAELDAYRPSTDALLDRIFDEYGLVVCGWSSDWDPALRRALERCKTHRFATYWCRRGPPSDSAARLIGSRRAVETPIESADAFFTDLKEKVLALRDITLPHPASAKILAATAKRYLAEERFRIRLHDLVAEEIERVHERVFGDEFPLHVSRTDEQIIALYRARVEAFERICEGVVTLVSVGCYWGTQSHDPLWQQCIERLASIPIVVGPHFPFLLLLQNYPALLVQYAAGLSALAANRYDTFAALLTQPVVWDSDRKRDYPVLLKVDPLETFQRDIANAALFGGGVKKSLPGSEHLFSALREPLRQIVRDDARYELLFDRFEYLRSLVQAHIQPRYRYGHGGVLGRYSYESKLTLLDRVSQEIDEYGTDWPLLNAGLFECSVDLLRDVKAKHDKVVRHDAAWRF